MHAIIAWSEGWACEREFSYAFPIQNTSYSVRPTRRDYVPPVGSTEECPPLNVSECDGVNCGQPSLLRDGKFVVFVKAEH